MHSMDQPREVGLSNWQGFYPCSPKASNSDQIVSMLVTPDICMLMLFFGDPKNPLGGFLAKIKQKSQNWTLHSSAF
jgi:hypothetical protein